MKKILFMIAIIIGLSSCQGFKNYSYYYDNNEQTTLQHPYTRGVIYCSGRKAQNCISNHENQGYVKMQNKVFMSANHDVLELRRYPERKWRENNIVARW